MRTNLLYLAIGMLSARYLPTLIASMLTFEERRREIARILDLVEREHEPR